MLQGRGRSKRLATPLPSNRFSEANRVFTQGMKWAIRPPSASAAPARFVSARRVSRTCSSTATEMIRSQRPGSRPPRRRRRSGGRKNQPVLAPTHPERCPNHRPAGRALLWWPRRWPETFRHQRRVLNRPATAVPAPLDCGIRDSRSSGRIAAPVAAESRNDQRLLASRNWRSDFRATRASTITHPGSLGDHGGGRFVATPPLAVNAIRAHSQPPHARHLRSSGTPC